MHQRFTNMDAMWLAALADTADQLANHGESILAEADINRLRAIANNLQSLDERNQNLMNATGGYAQGVADAEARMRRRSNVLANPEGEDAMGKTILEQINRRVAEGNVKKIALGERALEDAPDKFNAPLRKPKAKAVPKIELDLDFLGDL